MDISNVGKAIVDFLIKENVQYVFGMPGSHVLPVFNELIDSEVQYYTVMHENTAVYMAGMYGYLTGLPGVVLFTAGPGATNSVTAVAQAYASSLPLIHITGDAPLKSGNEAFHGVDQADYLYKMFRDITKWSVRIENATDLPAVLSKAFSIAKSGRPGPVHIDIPIDICSAKDFAIEPYQSTPSKSYKASDELIQKVKKAVTESKRPMICADRGVLINRAEKELIEFAETISAPVLLTTYAYGAFPQSHPLAVGTFNEFTNNDFAFELIKESDLLIVLGMRSNTLMSSKILFKDSKKVFFVAFDEENTLKSNDLEDIFISDVKYFLQEILLDSDSLKKEIDIQISNRISKDKHVYQQSLNHFLNLYEKENPLHFGVVLREIVKKSEHNAIFVSGVGNHHVWGRTIVPLENRESFIAEGPWATMGSEFGSGIMAKKIYPERQIIVLTGDGSFLMTASDIVTAVQMKTNIIVVVLNDSRYGMINNMQKLSYKRSYGDELGRVDFAQLAHSVGAKGIKVTDMKELPNAIEKSFELSKNSPVVLDIVCGYEFPWPVRNLVLKSLDASK